MLVKHYNTIFGKVNISILLPSSYVREVWDYRKPDVKCIQKAIQTFDRQKLLEIFLSMEKLKFQMKH